MLRLLLGGGTTLSLQDHTHSISDLCSDVQPQDVRHRLVRFGTLLHTYDFTSQPDYGALGVLLSDAADALVRLLLFDLLWCGVVQCSVVWCGVVERCLCGLCDVDDTLFVFLVPPTGLSSPISTPLPTTRPSTRPPSWHMAMMGTPPHMHKARRPP